MKDEMYMNIAISLAKKGVGFVNPNPLVGAVIVKNGTIIGQGWHETYGGLHAERNALANCSKNPKDATMYITLEPCCHYGKTPPCTEAIIQNGIKKVVIGCPDANELVSGKGIKSLKEAGIEVVVGVLESECRKLNEVFFHYMKTKTPYVVMKYAMTMDGKIATVSGESKWITNEIARVNVHKDRNRYVAIMVGIGTVIKDNPTLTCRIPNGRNPIRIICDTNLRMPLDSNVVETAKEITTIIATACSDTKKQQPYRLRGCDMVVVPKEDNHIDLNMLMKSLGERDIDSILLEGGSTLNFSALESKIVQKVQAYIAPKIFGGEQSKSPVGGIGVENIEQCFQLKPQSIQRFGEDILVESEVIYECLQEL